MGNPGKGMSLLQAQRGALFGWVPVCLAIGIGVFFSLRQEPEVRTLALLAASGAAILLVLWPRLAEDGRAIVAGLCLVVFGLILAAVRAHGVAAPVLEYRTYGPVEGRIIAIDRSQSDALRLTLDSVRMDGLAPDATPARVRLSLHGDRSLDIPVAPGLRVMTTAHLAPPSGPVEPGGFDFQRHAWFVRLGAVGYTRVPLMGVADRKGGLAVARLRMAASARITAVLPGDIGGFAAAITTGDRSGISRDALEALRASNLAHLLAISGLHMGLMSGVVFAALRLSLALVPSLALRWPTRSIAAGGALIVAAGYLALSGGNIATQRAFIMVAVALCALMIGRRAISLRAVAVAATLVLALRPEALLSPGFQMSFAATTALVAVFGLIRDRQWPLGPKWARPAVAVFISSAVAGLATAPIAAAHFNAVAQFGLIANLASVPLMGALVIPAALCAAVLAPFGFEAVGLWAMGLGVQWILAVAHTVAALPEARSYVPGPPPATLPCLALGALFCLLWQGGLRWAGLLGVAAAAVLWVGAERPALLIAADGALVGVMTPEGRALSRPRGAGFVAQVWLENDGDGSDQAQAAARWDGPQSQGLVHLRGKRAQAAFTGCASGEIVVSTERIVQADLPCTLHDAATLRKTGSLAYVRDAQGWRLQSTARARSGERLWTRWPAEVSTPPALQARAPAGGGQGGVQYVRISPTRRP